MLRRCLTPRRGLRAGPVRHRSARPKPMAIAGAASWIIGANRGQVLKLARPKMTRPLTSHVIGRWVEIAAPYVPQDAIGQPLTTTPGQGAFRRNSERLTIGRQERASEAGNQGIEIRITTRCCHETTSVKW